MLLQITVLRFAVWACVRCVVEHIGGVEVEFARGQDYYRWSRNQPQLGRLENEFMGKEGSFTHVSGGYPFHVGLLPLIEPGYHARDVVSRNGHHSE